MKRIAVFCLIVFLVNTLHPLYATVSVFTSGNMENCKMKCCQKSTEKSSKSQSKKEKKNCCDTNACNVIVNCGCCLMIAANSLQYQYIFIENVHQSIFYDDDANIVNYNSGYFQPPETLFVV